MLIRSLEVKNFRSIRQAVLDCENLTALAGRNGAGKSSFLYALDYFYDISAPVTDEDFFGRKTEIPIEIRVTFGRLSDEEKEEFQTYIDGDNLIVTKRISFDNGRFSQRYYASTLQIPQFAEVRAKAGKKERITAWKNLVESEELKDLAGGAKSADAVESLMSEYEAGHSELLKLTEREEQFFGDKNIGGGKLDKFTKYVLVPAVRDAVDEASGKKGAIYKILDMIVLRKINARKDIRDFKEEFDRRVKEVYSSENLKELPELGDSISETLEKFSPNSKLRLKWDEVSAPEVQLPAAKATLIEDSFEGEIDRKGHGLQRALILTLLQHLAMTVPTIEEADGDVETPTQEKQPSIAPQGSDLILAIEEPELYLHPSRCRHMADILLKLSEEDGIGMGARNQVIYTTHSPYFIDLDRFETIRILRKVKGSDSQPFNTVVSSFSLDKAAVEQARVLDKEPASFTGKGFRARSLAIMDALANEGFFAEVVLVVEGRSEVGTFLKLQEIMDKKWHEKGIVVVSAGGKNNLDRPTIIFRGLDIPTYFIFDSDSPPVEKPEEKKQKIDENHRCLRLAGAPMEDFPETQVHAAWAALRSDLEGVIKEALGTGEYSKIANQIGMELHYDKGPGESKSLAKAVRRIELIYEKGLSVPMLEEIVERVSQLHPQA